MKKVYIDAKLSRYVVPSEIRNNSISEGKIFTPGTRLPLENSKFVRLFTAWKASNNSFASIDVDLGASFTYKDKFNIKEIAYYSQHNSFASHSGDFTSCRAFDEETSLITSEYIDIDIEKAKNDGVKYILTSNIIYSGIGSYSDFDCWSGVELLNENRVSKENSIKLSNSLFKIKLDGNFRAHIGLAIDLETMEIVIIDKYEESEYGTNLYSLSNKMKSYKNLIFDAVDFKENMYNLLEMYCESKNYTLTNVLEEADIICSYDYFKDLSANKTQFNISDNLDKIISILD